MEKPNTHQTYPSYKHYPGRTFEEGLHHSVLFFLALHTCSPVSGRYLGSSTLEPFRAHDLFGAERLGASMEGVYLALKCRLCAGSPYKAWLGRWFKLRLRIFQRTTILQTRGFNEVIKSEQTPSP